MEANHLVFATGTPVHIRETPARESSLISDAAYQDMGYMIHLSELDAEGYPWANVIFAHGQAAGQMGWVRADLILAIGDLTVFGGSFCPTLTSLNDVLTVSSQQVANSNSLADTNVTERWPAPVTPYTITQAYEGIAGHRGVDLAGAPGAPVYAQEGGIVWAAVHCIKCIQGDGSLSAQGITNAASTYDDIGYGYGYGNYIITLHSFASLPHQFQAELSNDGLSGAYAFVLVGHLQVLSIEQGRAVTRGTEVGKRGSTGNSSGPHTHLQVFISLKASPDNIFDETLVEPHKLFAL